LLVTGGAERHKGRKNKGAVPVTERRYQINRNGGVLSWRKKATGSGGRLFRVLRKGTEGGSQERMILQGGAKKKGSVGDLVDVGGGQRGTQGNAIGGLGQ